MAQQNDGFNNARPSAETSKEEMAKMIARNMSMSDTSSFDTGIPQTANRQARPAGTKTAVRPAPQKKKSGTSAKSSTAKKKPTSKSKKKARKKSKAPILILATFIVLLICGGTIFYLSGMNSYKDTFLDNTYINGVDVSGKTKAEALALLKAQSIIPEKISFTRPNGQAFYIEMSELGYKDITKQKISEFYSKQDHYKWFSAKFNTTNFKFETAFSYDKVKLEKELKRKVLEAQTAAKPKNAYITEDGNGGYTIVKEEIGETVDESRLPTLYEYAEKEIDKMKFNIDLAMADIYEHPEVTSAMLQDALTKLNDLHNLEITFDFVYDSEVLTGDDVKDWIIFKGEDLAEGYNVDADKAMIYVEELAAKYDTYGKARKFNSTNHGEITVDAGSGCYGWWIDQEKTCQLICDLIKEGKSTTTKPVYYVNPDSQYEYTCNEDWWTADTDYSDTYIEVDLTAQHLWYYKNGKVMMESDIVSGYPNESRNTPEGVYKLWIKERSKTLTGSADGRSYASYVDYWNNISTIGVGLHDASWQNGVFGGEKYKSSSWGSHGCINMPFDKAKYVYENIDYGTPVFMYWMD